MKVPRAIHECPWDTWCCLWSHKYSGISVPWAIHVCPWDTGLSMGSPIFMSSSPMGCDHIPMGLISCPWALHNSHMIVPWYIHLCPWDTLHIPWAKLCSSHGTPLDVHGLTPLQVGKSHWSVVQVLGILKPFHGLLESGPWEQIYVPWTSTWSLSKMAHGWWDSQ
jgi:hypothetical protein